MLDHRWTVDIPRLVKNSVRLGATERRRGSPPLWSGRATARTRPRVFILRRRPFTEGRPGDGGGMDPGASGDRAGATWTRPTTACSRDEEPAESRREPALVDPVFETRPFFFARQKPWGIPGSMARPLRLILIRSVLCVFRHRVGSPAARRRAPTRPHRLLREPRLASSRWTPLLHTSRCSWGTRSSPCRCCSSRSWPRAAWAAA